MGGGGVLHRVFRAGSERDTRHDRCRHGGRLFVAIDAGNVDLRTVMGAVASGGAGIVLVGNLIIAFGASPLEGTRLHTQGMRSWELAVDLRFADGDPEAIREGVVRCEHDEAPPVRVVGSGVQFTF